MGFIRALIGRFETAPSIDAKRVYAFGYSNGGHMAFRLAMEAPDEIAAIAAVAANFPTPDASSCPQQGHTSRVMLVNRTDPDQTRIKGASCRFSGLPPEARSYRQRLRLRAFAGRNGITASPVAHADATRTAR